MGDNRQATGPVPSSVVIIEADELLQRIIKGYLEKINVKTIDIFSDGLAAVEQIERCNYDAIILDWRNKTPPGIEMFEYIKSHEKTAYTPLVLISGFVTKEDLNKASQHPNTAFLVKPFTEEILIGVMRRVCKSANENFLDQIVAQKRLYLYDEQAVGAEAEQGGTFNLDRLMGRGTDAHYGGRGAGQGFDMRQATERFERSDWRLQAGGSPNTPPAPVAPAAGPAVRRWSPAEGSGPPEQAALSGSVGYAGREGFPLAGDDLSSGKDRHGDPSEAQYPGGGGDIAGSSISYSKTGKIIATGKDIDYAKVQPQRPMAPGEIEYARAAAGRGRLIRSALVIDLDASHANIINKYLNDIKVSRIEPASDGEQAWRKLKQEAFDLVVMDWNLKGLSGLCVYNRIRTHQHLSGALVVILCGFAHKEDFRILEEHPMTRFLEKPFQREILERTVSDLTDYQTVHAEAFQAIRELIDPMLAGRVDTNEIVFTLDQRFPNNYRVFNMAGEYLLGKRLYQHAEKVLLHGLRLEPRKIILLSNLGKVYHHLNLPKKSYQLLRKANFLSPQNIERLCLLGELGLTLQQPQMARDHFKKVLSIDDRHSVANAGMILADNMEDHLRRYNNSEPLNMKFSSILNVIGITYVRNKDFERGIEQYIAAMSFIADPYILAKLQFNLGLAYLRARKFSKAEKWFSSAAQMASADFTKPQIFLDRLDDFRRSSSEELAELSNAALETVAA